MSIFYILFLAYKLTSQNVIMLEFEAIRTFVAEGMIVVIYALYVHSLYEMQLFYIDHTRTYPF